MFYIKYIYNKILNIAASQRKKGKHLWPSLLTWKCALRRCSVRAYHGMGLRYIVARALGSQTFLTPALGYYSRYRYYRLLERCYERSCTGRGHAQWDSLMSAADTRAGHADVTWPRSDRRTEEAWHSIFCSSRQTDRLSVHLSICSSVQLKDGHVYSAGLAALWHSFAVFNLPVTLWLLVDSELWPSLCPSDLQPAEPPIESLQLPENCWNRL